MPLCVCVCVLQAAGAGFGRKGDSLTGPVLSGADGGQEPPGTSPCLEFCQKELELSGSKVSMMRECE